MPLATPGRIENIAVRRIGAIVGVDQEIFWNIDRTSREAFCVVAARLTAVVVADDAKPFARRVKIVLDDTVTLALRTGDKDFPGVDALKRYAVQPVAVGIENMDTQ